MLLEHIYSTPWLVDEIQPDDMTALHLAALHGNLEVTDLLLQFGASPNLVARRPVGLQPLEGCDETKLGSHFTPINLAVHKAYPDVVCLLLCYGARAACQIGFNPSPLHLALTALNETYKSQVSFKL